MHLGVGTPLIGRGAKSRAECGCNPGSYEETIFEGKGAFAQVAATFGGDYPQFDDNNLRGHHRGDPVALIPPEEDFPANRSCFGCPTPGTGCVLPNTKLYELPLTPGYWRQHNWSIDVRWCDTPGACLGTLNASAMDACAPSQMGPYCKGGPLPPAHRAQCNAPTLPPLTLSRSYAPWWCSLRRILLQLRQRGAVPAL